MNDLFAPDLCAAVERALDQPDDWGRDRLHVTDLAVSIPGPDGKCERSLQLRLQDAERTPDQIGKQIMFDHSHRIHERLTQLLEMGLAHTDWIIVAIEQKVPEGSLPYGVTGTPDMVLLNLRTRQTVVVDFKSIRGKSFDYLDGPKPSWVLQVQTYMKVKPAELGVILVIDREGQNGMRQFVIERDDKKVDQAIEYAQEVRESEELFPVLEKLVKIRHNKTCDTVYRNAPWQCDYGEFRGPSCPGAVEKELEPHMGHVGRLVDGKFVPKKGLPEKVAAHVKMLAELPS